MIFPLAVSAAFAQKWMDENVHLFFVGPFGFLKRQGREADTTLLEYKYHRQTPVAKKGETLRPETSKLLATRS